MRISAGEKNRFSQKTRDRTGITNNTGHLSFLLTLDHSCQKGIKKLAAEKRPKNLNADGGFTLAASAPPKCDNP